jgi:hypothetical protein
LDEGIIGDAAAPGKRVFMSPCDQENLSGRVAMHQSDHEMEAAAA